MSQKITPFLWFNDNAGEAMDFYISVFKNGKVISKTDGANGKFFTGEVELEGQRLMFMNGGPSFVFSEAISLFVYCENQKEVDFLWDTLSAGGSESQCGWLKDKYGLSWQIIPTELSKLLSDSAKAQKVMAALMKMKKLDIAELEKSTRE